MSTTETKGRHLAGPMVRRAASLPVEGNKARRVLCYLAACEDGAHKPTVAEVARRIGVLEPGASTPERAVAIRIVDGVLAKLERAAWLTVTRSRGSRNV